jgi:6-phosphofructokinase 1
MILVTVNLLADVGCKHAIVFAAGGNAVHAAMAGKTGLVIGYLHDAFIHIPIEMLVLEKKQINPDGFWWKAVLATTGQPARFE